MVFLAEEGLCAEGGRAFDHAWQEMLNHATMRVKSSKILIINLKKCIFINIIYLTI